MAQDADRQRLASVLLRRHVDARPGLERAWRDLHTFGRVLQVDAESGVGEESDQRDHVAARLHTGEAAEAGAEVQVQATGDD